MKTVREAARAGLRRTPAWQPYQRWRHRRRLRTMLGPGHDPGVHAVLVALQQERERAGKAEASHGVGTTEHELESFFDGLHVVDPGLPLMRVGPAGDAGYLIPDDLDGVVACFSPGVAGEIGFDVEIADRGIPVHMIDRSVTGLPLAHPRIDFESLFVGTRTEPGWTTLTDWVERRSPGSADLLLEMDIEGAEWAVLLSTPASTLQRFRIMVLELHDLHLLSKRGSLQVVAAVLDKLREDFEMVHVHQNNHEYPVPYLGFDLAPVVEATFLRKDRVKHLHRRTELQHPLDSPNTDLVMDFALDPRWL